jgi:flagellar motility protein MotE (MotC chaperone)
MQQLKIALAWLKTNAVKILLIFLLILVLVLIVLAWWLKIRGFKVTDLLLQLQVATAKNEISYLQTKKAVLETKEIISKDEIQKIENEIKEEHKKAEVNKMKIQRMNDDEIASHLSELGF